MKPSSVSILAFVTAVVVALASAGPSPSARSGSADSAGAQFQEFKARYNKTYANAAEEARRFQIFAAKLEVFAQHNADPLATWQMGVNFFTDLTREEVEGEYMGAVPPSPSPAPEGHGTTAPAAHPSTRQSTGTPRQVDWRQTPGVVSPPRDQGRCGSCWAFAAIGALESAAALEYSPGAPFNTFSEQYLVDCDRGNGDYGCQGGWPHKAFNFLQSNQAAIAAQYHYSSGWSGSTGSCQSVTPVGPEVDQLLDNGGDEYRLEAMVAAAPTSVCLDADEFASYNSGVINKRGCYRTTNHCVLAVGYDIDAGHWILRNSWGTGWGEGGYVRVAMGSNMCGVADYGHRPVLTSQAYPNPFRPVAQGSQNPFRG